MHGNAVGLQPLLCREHALVSAALLTWPRPLDGQPGDAPRWDATFALEVRLLALEILCHPQILGELKRWRRVLGMLIATPSEASSRGRET